MKFKKEEGFVDFKEFLKKSLNGKDFQKYAVILGFSGISLIFVSSFFKPEVKSCDAKPNKKIASEQKRGELEKSLEGIVSGIKGAGDCRVLITLESGAETVYATEERKNNEASEDKSSGDIMRKRETNDCEKKFITVKDSSGTEHALAVTEIEPKVKGVVVICPGGDDAVVKKRIVEATTTALNISSARVCVTKSG